MPRIGFGITDFVRNHFDAITSWRDKGLSWPQIAVELQDSLVTPSVNFTGTVADIYRRIARKKFSCGGWQTWRNLGITDYIRSHFDAISKVRARGVHWKDIVRNIAIHNNFHSRNLLRSVITAFEKEKRKRQEA